MIATVRGRVTAVGPNDAVLEVGGDSAGLGYSVQCAPGTLARLRVGEPATLHTSLVVREDSLTLYGFADATERALFDLLQTASGVGPRLAQAVLAVLDPTTARRALATGDVRTLVRVPGVGKKVAERLILELRERVGPVPEPEQAPAGVPDAAADAGWQDQVTAGLTALGWSGRQAADAVATVAARLADGEPTPPVPALLKQAIAAAGRSS